MSVALIENETSITADIDEAKKNLTDTIVDLIDDHVRVSGAGLDYQKIDFTKIDETLGADLRATMDSLIEDNRADALSNYIRLNGDDVYWLKIKRLMRAEPAAFRHDSVAKYIAAAYEAPKAPKAPEVAHTPVIPEAELEEWFVFEG